eukprot:1382715-Lingulodinium_polyedra.AAC.1
MHGAATMPRWRRARAYHNEHEQGYEYEYEYEEEHEHEEEYDHDHASDYGYGYGMRAAMGVRDDARCQVRVNGSGPVRERLGARARTARGLCANGSGP